MVIRGEDPINTVIMLNESLDYPNVIVGNDVKNVTIASITIRLRSDKASTGIFLYEDIYGNSRNIRIENVYFYGGNPNETGEIGIFLRSAENIVITESHFIGIQNAVKCTSCSRVSLTDNIFKEISGELLFINRNSHDVSFTGNEVETSCTNTTTCSYIYVNEADTLRFTGNKFRSNLLNYINHEEWFNIGNSANIDIESNHFQLASYNALSTVVANISGTSDVFIANNRVEGGPIVYTGDGCSGVTVTNNMVSSSDLYAPGSNNTAILSPSDDDKNYLYDYQGTIFLEDKPLTATCVIETDGNGNYWALTSHGKIIESTNASKVYDKCREIIVTEDGGKIFFRKGTYTLSNPILLADKMVLQGEGMHNTIIKLDESSGSASVIIGVSVHGVVVSDLAIVLRDSTRTNGILIHGLIGTATYVHIRNVLIQSSSSLTPPTGDKGIYLDNVWKIDVLNSEFLGRYLMPIYCNECYRVQIEGNYMDGRGATAINVSNSENVVIRNNIINGYRPPATNPYNSTIVVRGSQHVYITDNEFPRLYNGLLSAYSSSWIYFDRNKVLMFCDDSGNACPYLIVLDKVMNSRISSNNLRTKINPASPATFEWINILDSSIITIDSNDINSSGSLVISSNVLSHATISSNVINTTNVASTSAISLCDADDVRIINNVIYAAGTDIFYIDCTQQNIIVSNNVLVGEKIFTGLSEQCVISPDDEHLNYIKSTP